MTEADSTAAPPAPTRFSVEYWAGFWGDPDPTRIGRLVAPDVVGDWAGDDEPVRGADAYRARIAQVLEQVPDLRLEVAEHAQNGNAFFIRWIASGSGVDGPFELDGIDRILVNDDGLVVNNVIRFDPAKLEALVGPR